jgi:hypothetical protein
MAILSNEMLIMICMHVNNCRHPRLGRGCLMGQLRLIMDFLEVCREVLLEVTLFKESEDHSTSSGEHNTMLA